MAIKKKDRKPSNNFCVVCGRYTNDKKFPTENWTNMFFICNNCKKVWCGACMGQVTSLGPNKAFKLGKKGQVNCPECNKFAAMVKLPENLSFAQSKNQEVSSLGGQFCKFCGESIPNNAVFCQVCGANQK
jgi:hypothetical protein